VIDDMTDISAAAAPAAGAAPAAMAPADGVYKAPAKVLGTMALGIAAILAVISIVSHDIPAFVITAMMALTIAGVGLRIYAAIRGAARRTPAA
jgi:hypothetical protein